MSNSSSSSFIVGFPKKPKDVEELRKMMFGDRESIDGDYLGILSTKDIAETVFNDFSIVEEPKYESRYGIVSREKAEKELDEYHTLSPCACGGGKDGRYHRYFSNEEIIEVFGNEYYKLPEYRSLENIWRQIDNLENEKPANEDERKYLMEKGWELEEDARKVVNEYIKRTRNDVFESPVILVTEYADGDGEYYAFMEHGDIFKNLPHIRINKH